MRSFAQSGKGYWRGNMKFSVLIPVYNSQKYLEDCIQSVLSQTYQNFEIVLVDDGSTDNSGKICDRYKTYYTDKVKVIHQRNQGQLASRCNAIKAASGEYCIFADSDDLLVENAFELIALYLDKYNYPDILIYSFYYESENGSRRKADKLFENGMVEMDKLHKMFYSGTGLNNVWTKAVKRDKALCKNFDFSRYYSLRCSEDKLYSMAMIDNCSNVAYIYEPLYIYKLVEGSVTRNYTVESIEKFNSIKTYDAEKFFLAKWDLELPEWQLRMDAEWARTAFYLFDLFYCNTSSKERKRVLEYDWSCFLDKETVGNIENNPYLNEIHKQLWTWILNKNYPALRFYLLKKKFRRIIKNMKN